MKTQAAVAWTAGQPLTTETVDLQGPKFGEVLVEIKATGICHTDYYALSGADPEGIYMEGKINIDDLITHTMPLADINKGFDRMKRGESTRGVVLY